MYQCKILLYTEYMLISVFMANFVPERCVPKFTLLHVSCTHTCMYIRIAIHFVLLLLIYSNNYMHIIVIPIYLY